ncbi:MAG: YlxR family protein [Chloroflexi bacterium]|nr:YlxR family protein [Chloroflexota bacterium]
MPVKRKPQRSCVACRTKTDKRNLIRLVIANERLQIDLSGKMNGRGAYLCGNRDCWVKASSQTQLGLALRQELSDGDRDYLRQMTPS